MTNLQRIDSASLYCSQCKADLTDEEQQSVRTLCADMGIGLLIVYCRECIVEMEVAGSRPGMDLEQAFP